VMDGTVEMVGSADTHQKVKKEEMGDYCQLTLGMVVLEVFQEVLKDRQEVEMEVM